MKTYKTHLALATIVGASFLAASPLIQAGESDSHNHGHAESGATMPASAAGALDKAQDLHREIAALVQDRKLGPVHELAEKLTETVGMLPALSTDLPASSLKRVEGAVRNLAQALDKMHDAADEGDQTGTEKQLGIVGSLLKVLSAQYPSPAADGHQH